MKGLIILAIIPFLEFYPSCGLICGELIVPMGGIFLRLGEANANIFFQIIATGSMEKARRDISKLNKKIIIDKNGHKKTVYVRLVVEVDKRGNVQAGKGNKVEKCRIAETDHEKGLTDIELKKENFLYAQRNFQGKIFKNADTGRGILVSRDGLDKWYNSTKSREQSISIKKLDVILENSVKINSEADKKNRHTEDGYTYFTNRMNINDKPYKIILLTRETHKKESKYYYHYLEDIKIEPDSGLA